MNPQVEIPNRLLSATEVAALLNVSRSFVYKLIDYGNLPCVRIRRALRVRPEALQAFIEKNSTTIHVQGAGGDQVSKPEANRFRF